MAGLFSKKEVIALDVGSNSIKLVQLKKVKKGWELEKLALAYLPPEAIVDGSIIDSMTVSNTVQDIVSENKVKITDIVTALTGHSVIIKKVNIPAMSEDDLADSIQWEAEQFIPYPIGDVNLDFQILGDDPEGRGEMEVMLVAVKKDVINDYTNVFKEAGLNPVVVDIDSFAIENMLEINYAVDPEEIIAIVHIGASITSISILMGGMTVFTRSVPNGGNQVTEEIQRQFNISFKDAEDFKLGKAVEGLDPGALDAVLESVSHGMIGEIKRSIDFFLSGAPGLVVNRIVLSGGGAKAKGFKERVQEMTDMPVELANPFENIIANPKKFDPEFLNEMGPNFAVAIGLAIRKMGD